MGYMGILLKHTQNHLLQGDYRGLGFNSSLGLRAIGCYRDCFIVGFGPFWVKASEFRLLGLEFRD